MNHQDTKNGGAESDNNHGTLNRQDAKSAKDNSDDNLKSTRSANNDNDDNDDGAGAEFQVKIQLKSKKGTPVLTQSKGQCDVDLVTTGVQPGVPGVKAGDVATASVVDSSTTRTLFLQGTFVQH